MKKARKIFNEIEDNLLAAMILVMAILAFVNVIARYVFLASFPWVEELNRLGLVILSYMGAAVALKNNAHLGLTIVTDKLPAKAQKVVAAFGCVCGVFFCVIAVYYGFIMVISEKSHNVLTQGMQWPEYLFGMWLPIGCIVLGIRFIQLGIYTFTGKTFYEEEENK